MSILLLLLPALTAALLDLTLSPGLRAFGGHPSVSVALVAAWAVLRRREEAMLLAPLTGLLLGLLGNEPLGASLLALAPTVVVAQLHDVNKPEGRLTATLGTAFAGAALYVALVAATEAAVGRGVPAPAAMLRAMGATGLLTTAIALLLYWPLARSAWQPRVHGEFRRY